MDEVANIDHVKGTIDRLHGTYIRVRFELVLHVGKNADDDHDANERYFFQLFSEKKHQNDQHYRQNQRNNVETFEEEVQNGERVGHG